MAESVAFWSAATFYALASGFYFIWFGLQKRWGGDWGYRIAVVALIPHTVALVMRWIEVGHGPYNTRYEVLSANAFFLAAAYVLIAKKIRGLYGLGVLILPAVFLQLGFSVSTFEVKQEVPIIFKSYWLLLHIGFAKSFMATTILAAGCAAIYLAKHKNPMRLPQFPDKSKLDLYAYQFLLVSFLFLGIMIAAGALWAHQSWGRYWGWDPIETSSFVTWVAYGVILHFRVLHGWSGKRMAYLTFVALFFGVTTLYVVTLVVPTIHNSYLVGK